MKKNVLMRAASGLLVATMLTTCAISGTFAKYVTQDKGGDIARVAKWGVVVQVEGDLYGKKYLNLQDGGTGNTVTAESGNTVGVDGEQIAPHTVVAPGSKSDSPFAFSINGKPEVDSKTKVEIKAQNIYLNAGTYGVMVPVDNGVVTKANYVELATKGLYYQDDNKNYVAAKANDDLDVAMTRTAYYTLEDYVVSNEKYYPVVYNMDGTTTKTSFVDPDGVTGAKTQDTLKALSEEILKAVDPASAVAWTDNADGSYTATATSAVIENNTDLVTALKLQDQKITWDWEFHDEIGEEVIHVTDETHCISQQDKLDTILGNLMAEREHKVPANQTTFPDGEVVKLYSNSTDSYYKAPVEITDYCLDTMFGICIVTEQVD